MTNGAQEPEPISSFEERGGGPPGLSTSAGSAAVLKTLLLSDLVGSTKLVERIGDERAFSLFGRHDRLARDLMRAHGGLEIDKTDGFLLLFDRPIDAVRYAVAYHRAMKELSQTAGVQVAARVGIHLGEVYLRPNPPEDVARGAKPMEVEGLAKPMAARIMSLALGNQTLLTRTAFDVGRRATVGEGEGDAGLKWLAHGAYLFKGIDEPVKVFEVGLDGLSPLAPPPGSDKVQRMAGDETILGWRPAPGQEVPHRPNWELRSKLGEGGFGEVWLAQHRKTHERRVLKFCFDVERLRGLQREVTLFRLLKEALGNREDIARILDWSFEEPPYFVESEYTEGGSLLDWAARQGGVAAVPLRDRLELAAQVADALAAAHSVGVLHKDLKPANVLIHKNTDGSLQARLADFGIGLVMDRRRLAEAGITALGFDQTALEDAGSMTGTQAYMAPELLEGRPATVQADIFALGILVYQLAVGDLKRVLAPGWEREVTEELLREDIAALADGSPERRLADAAEAARRLRRLEQRRAERDAEQKAMAEAEANRLALVRTRKRRKLMAVAVGSLVVFGAAMTVQSLRVSRWARRAEAEAETAHQVADFLVNLFEVAQPERARGHSVTALEVVDAGAEKIGTELAEQPMVRARVMEALGGVYFRLGVYDRAEKLFGAAVELQSQAQGRVDTSVATAMMNLAGAYLNQGRLADAHALLTQALTIKEKALGPDHKDVGTLVANLAMVSYLQGRCDESVRLLERARGIYERAADVKMAKRADVLQNLATAYRCVGRFQEAETTLNQALTAIESAEGADHPGVAQILDSIGQLQESQGSLDKSEASYRRALEIRTNVLPADHPLALSTQCRLARLLAVRGSLDEAESMLSRALATAEGTLGPTDELVADALVGNAEVAMRQGKPAAAEGHLTRAIEIYRVAYGPDDPVLADPWGVLAAVYVDTNRLTEAASLLARALKVVETASGKEHPDLAPIAADLAGVYARQGRKEEARALLERAIGIRRRVLGDAHPIVAELRKQAAAL